MNGEVITHSHFWLDCPVPQAKPPQWSAQQWSSSGGPWIPVQLKAADSKFSYQEEPQRTLSASLHMTLYTGENHGPPLKCCKLFLSPFYLILFPTQPNFWMQSRFQVYQAETGVVRVYKQGWVRARGGRWGPSSSHNSPFLLRLLFYESPVAQYGCHLAM